MQRKLRGHVSDVFEGECKGDQIHPLFRHLTNKAKGMLGTKAVKWNFTKFLVDQTGENVERFSPQTNPKEMEEAIQKWLG